MAILANEPVGIVANDEIYEVEKLSSMVELLLQHQNQQLKPSEKLVLTIDECSKLTGFSRGIIREAIATGDLKAKIIGKS
ncbi:MAG: hypothetical protein F6K62_23130 [Sphaerospermopsis sp. SIO1G2]|nr:hypothetical protein [Sphaerospermopsis sp. SIO1G2]